MLGLHCDHRTRITHTFPRRASKMSLNGCRVSSRFVTDALEPLVAFPVEQFCGPFEVVIVERAQRCLQPQRPASAGGGGAHRGAALQKNPHFGQRGQRLSIESHDHAPRMTAQAHLSLESRCLLQAHVSLKKRLGLDNSKLCGTSTRTAVVPSFYADIRASRSDFVKYIFARTRKFIDVKSPCLL